MSQYEEFCKELGKKYETDYISVCTDGGYNKQKTLNAAIDKNQYIQAAAEQVFYYKLKKAFKTIEYDKNVNPENDTDVDLYYDGNPFNLRIEVKTPVMFENTEKFKEDLKKGITIHGTQNHRYPESVVPRQKMNEALHEIADMMGSQVAIKKMDDNKIKDYLESAQNKMVDSDAQTINALLICLSSSDLVTFFDYIVNPHTGLASRNPYIDKEKYSKVDFIILSNCVEGQIDNNFKFNVWDANNYVNLVIPNTNKLSSDNYQNKILYICTTFDDQFICYNSQRDNYISIGDDKLDDNVGMMNFLAEKFPQFIPNKGVRKY